MQEHVAALVAALHLRQHPEGGWFAEVYRSHETVHGEALPARYTDARCFATSIYFLITSGEFSSFHRLQSDEVWHFYAGSGATIVTIDDEGRREDLLLGPDIARGQQFQAVVPAGRWFASFVHDADAFALCGCTVAPGFDFADFELADRAALLAAFPHHTDIIRRLTR